jgi:transposase
MNNQLELSALPNKVIEPTKDDKSVSVPRLNSPQRNQIEFIQSSIDDLIQDDHPVRSIWNYVNQMDMSQFHDKIKSTTDHPGRPAIDPKVLFALWIYAISEGIGSARVIDRYCTQHLAFRWLCGSVSVNYHTISDFRKKNVNEFDNLISLTIARLMNRDLISLKRVSQDGMRVRASAGSSSFRRKPKLKELLAEAQLQVEILRGEIDKDPACCLNRQEAAKKRAAEERKNRVAQALKEHKMATIEKGIFKKNIASFSHKTKKTKLEPQQQIVKQER